MAAMTDLVTSSAGPLQSRSRPLGGWTLSVEGVRWTHR